MTFLKRLQTPYLVASLGVKEEPLSLRTESVRYREKVQNPRLREISRAEGGVFSNASRLEAVYGHSFSISSIDFVV